MSKRRATKRAKSVPYTIRAMLRDVFVFLRPYRSKLWYATGMRASGDVVGLVPDFAMASLVTFASGWRPGQPFLSAFWWLGAWYGAVLIRQLTRYQAKKYGHRVGEAAALDARRLGMAKLFRLDIGWHERENAGNKLKRIDSGADAILRLVRMWINNYIEIGVTTFGALIVLATIDRDIALASLLFLSLYIPVVRVLHRHASVAARAVNAAEEDLHGSMFEAVNNIRTAKVLDMAPALMKVVGTSARKALDLIYYRIFRFQRMNVTQGLLSATFKGVAAVFILYGVFQGWYELGFLILFNGYFNRLTEAARELADVSQVSSVAKHSIERMMSIFQAPEDDLGTRNMPDDWQTISLKKVSYDYEGQAALRGVSFDIRRGERIGIVGSSGAGKSTLFKLLLKEIEGYSGSITVDDLPLKEIGKQSFYKRAAVVLQETEVFNFSLQENIAIAAGSRRVNRPALQRALDVAHVTDFVGRLPGGVRAVIGEKGVKLSGGERQRVGIARAVYKQPDILFLDEATSHLDLESEERIRESLHSFFKHVTAVVIAHRLTTIKEMDRIIVMEHGRVVEHGTFDELYDRGGRFRKLWDKQKLDR